MHQGSVPLFCGGSCVHPQLVPFQKSANVTVPSCALAARFPFVLYPPISAGCSLSSPNLPPRSSGSFLSRTFPASTHPALAMLEPFHLVRTHTK